MIFDNYGRRFFAMYDPEPKKHGLSEITELDQLVEKNKKHFGIFWTVNKIREGLPRKKENLEKINAIAFEVDSGTKDQQLEQIKRNLTPTLVIETRRGFHSYFYVNDFEPDADKYRAFLLDRVIPFYGADSNAADATRILRVPTFFHWKELENPFMVRVHHINEEISYTKKQLEAFFPLKEKKEIAQRAQLKAELSFQKDTSLFDRIFFADQGDLLKRLSGTEAVGSESISIVSQKNGKSHILVNGKSTNTWIDANKRIGSSDGGGPTVWQWVNWYHKDHRKTFTLLKKYLPELFNEQP